MKTVILVTLALLIVMGAGCNFHKPSKTLDYGPFSTKSYHVGSGIGEQGNRVWCEVEINGKKFPGPENWNRIYTCNRVEGVNDSYLNLQVYVKDGEYNPQHALISVINGVTKVEPIIGPPLVAREQNRLLTHNVEGGHTIHDPDTGERTRVDFPGMWIEFSPAGTHILSLLATSIEETDYTLVVTEISTGSQKTYTLNKAANEWMKAQGAVVSLREALAPHFDWLEGTAGDTLVWPPTGDKHPEKTSG